MNLTNNDNFFQKIFFSTSNFFVKHPFLRYILKWLFVSLIIGICAGTASALFLSSLEWVTNYRESNPYIIIFLPLAGLAIGLGYFYFGESIIAGNKIIIDNAKNPQTTIPSRMAVFVYLGTIITHLFGGSAGREGTAIQMSGAIADMFSKPLKLSKEDRSILLKSAIAAGFGSVFGTPLAGAVFALEVFKFRNLKLASIFPIIASSIIADIVTKLWGVSHTIYHVYKFAEISFVNFFYTIIAGIAFGLCARLFCKLMDIVTDIFKKIIKYPPLRPAVGAIIILILIYLLGTTKYLGLGVPYIEESFYKQASILDFGLKIVFTVITLSAGFKGGEVTPLFFIGACLGSALSMFLPLPIGALTCMGFVAVFAGATNAPFACSIMAIELFGFNGGLFAFVACMVSYLFSGKDSIYEKYDAKI